MKKVLIIDDEIEIRDLLADYFRREFKLEDFTFAADGFEAFTETSLQTFDLICLDHIMPHCNGDQFLSALREKSGPNQKTVVVMISGHIPELPSEIKSMDATYFLEKPVDFERLGRYAKISFRKEHGFKKVS